MPASRKETSHNASFAKGGNGHMFSEQAAGEQKPAQTSQVENPAPGAEFAKGGSGKMFGFAGSQSAKAGQTSAR